MSTRCTIHFHGYGSEEPQAIVYRHNDGYPESMVGDLHKFFTAVEEQTADTRFTDPTYLAAKFVVWLAAQFAVKYEFTDTGYITTPAAPLDFLSVGVVTMDPGDIEYRYHVWADRERLDGYGRPQITFDNIFGD